MRGTSTSGPGYVKATISPISGGCGSTTIQYNLWVGPPAVGVTGPNEGCTNNTYNFVASSTSSYSNASTYTWDLQPLNGNTLSPFGYQNSSCAITFYNPYSASGYWVKARAQNTCGVGTYGQTNIWVHTCYTFIASPNPASESVTLTKVVSEENQNTAIEQVSDDSNTTYTIKILNYYGSLLLSTTRSGVSFNIPISSLKDGNYIIQISDGKDLYNIPLIVKH